MGCNLFWLSFRSLNSDAGLPGIGSRLFEWYGDAVCDAILHFWGLGQIMDTDTIYLIASLPNRSYFTGYIGAAYT